jgi:hypothetical protein
MLLRKPKPHKPPESLHSYSPLEVRYGGSPSKSIRTNSAFASCSRLPLIPRLCTDVIFDQFFWVVEEPPPRTRVSGGWRPLLV